MSAFGLRLTSAVLLLMLVCFYGWVSMRSEPRLTTIPFLPYAWAIFFDLNPLARSFPAFFVLGVLTAGAVTGLNVRWQYAALALCLLAPVLKDVAQMTTATRHFDSVSTLLGMAGAAVGWGAGMALLRWLKI